MKTVRIFLIHPSTDSYAPIFRAVKEAVMRASEKAGVMVELERVDLGAGSSATDEIHSAIQQADLVLCDFTDQHPGVMYELGYASALHKPFLLFAHYANPIPFDVARYRTFMYDKDDPGELFKQEFAREIEGLLPDPSVLIERQKKKESSRNNVFVSYSHRDGKVLSRLLIHLRPLEKQGIIDFWADTKLSAGDKWKAEIEKALDRSGVAVLLISADFLASDFIVDNELPPLLSAAEAKGTKIIPVILSYCRFTRDENLRQFQAINDPANPLLTMSEAERERILDQIAAEIERHVSMHAKHTG